MQPGLVDLLKSPFKVRRRDADRQRKTREFPGALSRGDGSSLDSGDPVIVSPNRDMVKSNKFDYSNRASEGVKLGRVIGDAFRKEVDKAKKDAERQAAKVRKQSTHGAGNPDCGKDLGIHVIDLKATGKHLGDEGVAALAAGLADALSAGTFEASLALEDVNLQGNDLTTASLALLAPVIILAKHDLKTLNLSSNRIRVVTEQEALQWEAFLLSFKDCFKLRRIDLSGNKELGPKALEIFARVHHLEPAISPIATGGDAAVRSLAEQDDGDENDGKTADPEITGREGNDSLLAHNLATARLIKRRCGLRSIPYLSLADSGLTDAGALWLSFTLQDHFFPEQLIDEINAAPANSTIAAYQQTHGSAGIEWENNDVTLGKDGVYLLKKTEAIRKQLVLDDKSSLSDSLVFDTPDNPSSQWPKAVRASAGHRRVSLRSIHTDDGGEHEITELDSVRHKIQRHIIHHNGIKSVELWQAALSVVTLSRTSLILTPPTKVRKSSPAPPKSGKPPPDSRPPYPHATLRAAPVGGTRGQRTYASALTVVPNSAGEPELAITDISNYATPTEIRSTTHRKEDFSEDSGVNEVAEKLGGIIVRDDKPDRFIEWQEAQMPARQSRDANKAMDLPLAAFERILSFSMADREIRLLSEAQRKAAFEWGQNRETLTAEREWMRMTESAQVLTLLDSIKCLSYVA